MMANRYYLYMAMKISEECAINETQGTLSKNLRKKITRKLI